MTTAMHTIPCWHIYVWRGHWVRRSTHDSQDNLLDALAKVEPCLRRKVVPGTRRVAGFVQPDPPTAARAHREAVAAKMAVRQQAMKLYKSSANGTELATIPEEGVV